MFYKTEEIDERRVLLEFNISAGQKLTILAISEALAHTQKSEILVTRTVEPEPRFHYVNGPCDRFVVGAYRHRGKRKDFVLSIPVDALVFDGWDLPIKIDSELKHKPGSRTTISFSGNACFNLAGDPEVIKEYIEKRNLNGNTSEANKGRILIVPTDAEGYRDPEGEETLLYPEIETGHAVIQRIKRRAYA